ncbi:MAG: hypothetical protein J6W00_03950 [Lentisphaeria bacterium]|nr:hypothetical protein [Lentisphaeria bacterium]
MSSFTNGILSKKNTVLVLIILSVCAISGFIINAVVAKRIEKERIKLEIIAVWEADSSCGKDAKSTREHCYRMQNINIANCPEDFQRAYIARYQAWEKMADFEEVDMAIYRRQYTSWLIFMEAMARSALTFDFSIFTEEREAARKLGDKYTSIWGDIRKTLDEAFLISRKYGIDTSSYEKLAR